MAEFILIGLFLFVSLIIIALPELAAAIFCISVALIALVVAAIITATQDGIKWTFEKLRKLV